MQWLVLLKPYPLLALFMLMIAPLFYSSFSYSASLLVVSYDPTRELLQDYHQLFIPYWQQKTGQKLTIATSHGGSAKQARAVMDGLPADIVNLALSGDIDAINQTYPLIEGNWLTRFANQSSPFSSTIVFLVRKSNPKQITDWSDLIKEGVEVIIPNPKTSGSARWTFLAAWAYGRQLGGEQQAQQFVTDLFRHVPILDSGARAATITFVQRGIGDVLLTWENEAHLAIAESNTDDYQIVLPSISILAQPSITFVDKVVDYKNNRALATAYIDYLYSHEAQTLIAKHYYRPANADIALTHADTLPPLSLVSIDTHFGGWSQAQTLYFNDGAIFDTILAQIYQH